MPFLRLISSYRDRVRFSHSIYDRFIDKFAYKFELYQATVNNIIN